MSHSAVELVRRLRPLIEILFTSHEVPRERGQQLLEELVLTFQLKRNSIADPEAWLIASLHRAIRRMEGQDPS